METTRTKLIAKYMKLSETAVHPWIHKVQLEGSVSAAFFFDHEQKQEVQPGETLELPLLEHIPAENNLPYLKLWTHAEGSLVELVFYLFQVDEGDERAYFYSVFPNGDDPQLIGRLAKEGPGQFVQLNLRQDGEGESATIVIGDLIIDP